MFELFGLTFGVFITLSEVDFIYHARNTLEMTWNARLSISACMEFWRGRRWTTWIGNVRIEVGLPRGMSDCQWVDSRFTQDCHIQLKAASSTLVSNAFRNIRTLQITNNATQPCLMATLGVTSCCYFERSKFTEYIRFYVIWEQEPTTMTDWAISGSITMLSQAHLLRTRSGSFAPTPRQTSLTIYVESHC
jgi:hypothetical protein